LNAAGLRHSLADHLYGAAELAGTFAAPFGARDAGHFLGLAHDAGKASCSWQEGLARAEISGGRVGGSFGASALGEDHNATNPVGAVTSLLAAPGLRSR
jgi:hypothetical protein